MYNIYKINHSNKNTYDYHNFYYIKTDDSNAGKITSDKVIKACKQVASDGKANPDDLMMSVSDKNIFLSFRFSYRTNLLSFLDTKNKYRFNYVKYNNCIYTDVNTQESTNFAERLQEYNVPILSEYNKCVEDPDLLKLFGDKYHDAIKLNNSFVFGNILFLNSNISKLKDSTITDYSFNHNKYYLLTDNFTYDKQYSPNMNLFNSNITMEKSGIKLKNLLKLKNKDYYSIDFNTFGIDGEILYNNLNFVRASDFGIDISKYKNIFELGLNNTELISFLESLKKDSLNKFKECCNTYYSSILKDLTTKINFINNINLSNMYIH